MIVISRRVPVARASRLCSPRNFKRTHRISKTFERPATEIHEVDPIRYKAAHHLRHDYGIGFGTLTKARRHLYRRSKQVVAVGDRLSGVQANPNPELFPTGQIEGIERLLNGTAAIHRSRDFIKRSHDPVSGVLHLSSSLVI